MAKVDILMPFKEVDLYLRYALESISRQSYKDIKLILVCNGNDEQHTNALALLERYKKLQAICIREKIIGVGVALNAGLTYCDSEYIARMDADDIMSPTRIEEQINILEGNQVIKGIGSNASIIDSSGTEIRILNLPKIQNIDRMRSILRYENPYIHPSITIRAPILQEYKYNEGLKGCEDWNLWVRLANEGHLIENLDKRLMKYRIHPNQETKLKDKKTLREPLLQTLKLLDPKLVESYMFQRPYLEDTKPQLREVFEVVRREIKHLNTFYSVKKLTSALVRSFKQ